MYQSIESRMRIAQDTKKEFTLHKDTGKWSWYDRGYPEALHPDFDTFEEALNDAIEPYLDSCEDSEAAHTPGPWRPCPTYHGGDGKQPTGFYISSDTITVINGMPAVACSVEEMLANARLIAAAPKMLEALIEAKAMLETARGYFPKSIKNRDRFQLLNVLANSIEPAIDAATQG